MPARPQQRQSPWAAEGYPEPLLRQPLQPGQYRPCTPAPAPGVAGVHPGPRFPAPMVQATQGFQAAPPHPMGSPQRHCVFEAFVPEIIQQQTQQPQMPGAQPPRLRRIAARVGAPQPVCDACAKGCQHVPKDARTHIRVNLPKPLRQPTLHQRGTPLHRSAAAPGPYTWSAWTSRARCALRVVAASRSAASLWTCSSIPCKPKCVTATSHRRLQWDGPDPPRPEHAADHTA